MVLQDNTVWVVIGSYYDMDAEIQSIWTTAPLAIQHKESLNACLSATDTFSYTIEQWAVGSQPILRDIVEPEKSDTTLT